MDDNLKEKLRDFLFKNIELELERGYKKVTIRLKLKDDEEYIDYRYVEIKGKVISEIEIDASDFITYDDY